MDGFIFSLVLLTVYSTWIFSLSGSSSFFFLSFLFLFFSGYTFGEDVGWVSMVVVWFDLWSGGEGSESFEREGGRPIMLYKIGTNAWVFACLK